jgi:hypothetical protein
VVGSDPDQVRFAASASLSLRRRRPAHSSRRKGAIYPFPAEANRLCRGGRRASTPSEYVSGSAGWPR